MIEIKAKGSINGLTQVSASVKSVSIKASAQVIGGGGGGACPVITEIDGGDLALNDSQYQSINGLLDGGAI